MIPLQGIPFLKYRSSFELFIVSIVLLRQSLIGNLLLLVVLNVINFLLVVNWLLFIAVLNPKQTIK